MNGSKLLEMVKSFSPAEGRRFLDFLKSPFFNTNPTATKLFQKIWKQAPAFPPARLDRYLLFSQINPQYAPDDKEIAYQMSDLLRLAERFLGQVRYEAEKHLVEYHILDACEERALEKHYRQQLKRLRRLPPTNLRRSEDHLHHQYQISGVEVRHLHRKQVRASDQNMQQLVDHLDEYYLVSKLRLTCELINRQSILSDRFAIRQVDELLVYVKHHDQENKPAMMAYHQLLLLLTDQSHAAGFEKLRSVLTEHFGSFTIGEKRELFSYAQNYCIRQVRAGEADYLKALFDLYKVSLQSDFWLEDGIFSPWKYKNMASVGLRVGEFEWVERFLEGYRPKLPLDFRENAWAYNMADLHYHQGRYEEALRGLMRVEFTDVFYSLDTRKMMLMIYLEQGAEEPLISLVSSFKLYLRRNKLVAENTREAYLNFVNLVYAVQRAATRDVGAAELEARIRETQPLVEEAWLLGQVRRVVG